jgi:hypothetical protein
VLTQQGKDVRFDEITGGDPLVAGLHDDDHEVGEVRRDGDRPRFGLGQHPMDAGCCYVDSQAVAVESVSQLGRPEHPLAPGGSDS